MSSSSHVLLLASNSIQSLVPSSLITQVESLLDAHKLEDAFNLADARRKKLEESLEVNQDEVRCLSQLCQQLLYSTAKVRRAPLPLPTYRLQVLLRDAL